MGEFFIKIKNLLNIQKKSKFSKDVVITFVTQIIIMICGFAINKIVSNRLSVDDFGLFNVIKRSSSVLGFVLLAGTGITLPRYISLYRSRAEYLKTLNIIRATVLFVLTISFVALVIMVCFRDNLSSIVSAKNDSLFFSPLIYAFAVALSSLAFAYYRGRNDFFEYNSSQVTIRVMLVFYLLIAPVVTVSNIYLGFSLITLSIAAIFVFRTFYKTHLVLFKRFRWQSVLQELKVVSSYSTPRMIGDFFLFSQSAFPVIFLSNYADLKAVSYFSIGVTFITVVSPLYSFLGTILLPYVSGNLAKKSFKQAERLVNKLALLYLVTSVIITGIILLFTPFLIKLLFSKEFVVATGVSRILALSIVPNSIYLLLRNPIDAVSTVPYNTFNVGFCFVLLIFLFFVSSSLTQMAWSYSVVILLQGILSFVTWIIILRRK